MSELGIVVACSDRSVLEQNLLRSPCVNRGDVSVGIVEGYCNVPAALNEGAHRRFERYLAFIHQDVFLPEGWDARVLRGIEQLPYEWMCCGPAGVNNSGVHVGDILNCGKAWGCPHDSGYPVQTLDEVCLIVNISEFSYGRPFDETNPAAHLYGADLTLDYGNAHTIDAPLEHNRQKPNSEIDLGFFLSAGWLYAKHGDKLPIHTTCCTMTKEDGILKVVM